MHLTTFSIFGIARRMGCLSCVPILFTSTVLSNFTYAMSYFSDDFESGGLTQGASPIWAWKPQISADNITRGMMYGDSDVYQVSNDLAHSGQYSLRLDFSGRNGWCNTCGSTAVTLSDVEINTGCINLAGYPWGDAVFNKSNGFSKWSISSANASTVCFDTSSPLGSSMFGKERNSFAVGDELAIPLRCGVNGNVGGQVDRKSDCNKSINYLNNVAGTDLAYGEILSRRFYMYIPEDTKLPEITLKLGYSHWRAGGVTKSVKLKLSVQRGLSLELNMPNGETHLPGYSIDKNEWYYFEELFVRESAEGANDAAYYLYVAPSGQEQLQSQPIVYRTDFNLGQLKDISMHGNWQHNDAVSGYIYFDDILFSSGFAGQVETGSSPPSPNPPSFFRVKMR